MNTQYKDATRVSTVIRTIVKRRGNNTVYKDAIQRRNESTGQRASRGTASILKELLIDCVNSFPGKSNKKNRIRGTPVLFSSRIVVFRRDQKIQLTLSILTHAIYIGYTI